MKTTLTLAFAILASASSAFADIRFFDTTDVDKAHTNIRITDARLFQMASKTEIREIPNCHPEYGPCTEEVAIERRPVVIVEVTYTEGFWRDPDMKEGYVNFLLDPATFTESEMATLEAHSRLWDFSGKHSRARKSWWSKRFALETTLASRTIQVVDVRNSKLCPISDHYPDLPRNCVEHIVYRPAQTKVREIKVIVK